VMTSSMLELGLGLGLHTRSVFQTVSDIQTYSPGGANLLSFSLSFSLFSVIVVVFVTFSYRFRFRYFSFSLIFAHH